MSRSIPCIFEINAETNEATGHVAPFCSDACREKAGGETYSGFKLAALGSSHLSDFGYDPHCEECSAEITDAA